MTAIAGLQVIGTYANVNGGTNIDSLLDAIPDPDAAHGTGAVAGGGHLDEMSPGCAAQLRVELAALLAANGVGGRHTVTADEAAANLVNIVTGVVGMTLAHCSATVWRAGVNVTVDAVLSEPVDGTLRIADGGATYNTTAGDIIVWSANT